MNTIKICEIQVFKKHEPFNCSYCNFEMDKCCGPNICPRCGLQVKIVILNKHIMP